MDALDSSAASSVDRNTDMSESLVQKVVNKIEPPELRKRIKNSQESWTTKQKSGLLVFQTTLSAFAIFVAQAEMARAGLKRRFSENRSGRLDDTEVGNAHRSQKRHKPKLSALPSHPNPTTPRSSWEKWHKPC